jgi:hypothetical protein
MTYPHLNGSVVPKYPKLRMSMTRVAGAGPAENIITVKPNQIGFYDARRQTGDGGLKSPPSPSDRQERRAPRTQLLGMQFSPKDGEGFCFRRRRGVVCFPGWGSPSQEWDLSSSVRHRSLSNGVQ